MDNDITTTLPFKLARLMIALGWADGNLSKDEINAMKNIIFGLKGITAEDWGKLEVFMEVKPDENDMNAIVSDVINSIGNQEEKKFVLEHLKELIEADGNVSPEEEKIFKEISSAVFAKSTGLIGLLSSITKNIIQKSSAFLAETLKQEEDLDTYLENKILYDIKKKFPEKEKTISKEELTKWSSGAGLLGRIAIVDGHFDEKEKNTLSKIMKTHWNLSTEMAEAISELVKKRIEEGEKNIHKKIYYDYLSRNFYKLTGYAERVKFIELLFQIANSSNKTSFDEIEEIRSISIDLKVSHGDFIKAKLTIPSKDRNGM